MKHQISILTEIGQQMTFEEFKKNGLNANNAIGIILQTPVIGMVVSLDCFEEKWGSYGDLITTKKGDPQNLMDLSGLELTKQIVNYQLKKGGDKTSAAKRCWGYHRKTNAGTDNLQWYLPSAYELCTICAFKDEIKNAMIAIGVSDEAMLEFDDWFWSSSESYGNSAVYVYFTSGNLYNNNKNSSHYVRAVSAFQPLSDFNTLPCELHEQGTFDSSISSDDELIKELRKRGFVGEVVKRYVL